MSDPHRRSCGFCGKNLHVMNMKPADHAYGLECWYGRGCSKLTYAQACRDKSAIAVAESAPEVKE